MKKKMFIAGMSLAVALVLLATASFAWVTISTSPEVKGMDLALYTDRTLLLAPGDGTGTAPDSDEFKQYISLSSAFKGMASLRPVSTADGINWFLPAYDTESGDLGQIEDFILDNTLQYANVSVLDAGGDPLTGEALLEAQSRGYYVYTDFWMKTEEDGAKVRLSIPHTYADTTARHSGTGEEPGLNTEEIQKAVYGTYVLGEPELDESDVAKLKARNEEPETALRVGFLIYQDTETLKPVTAGIGADGVPEEDVQLPFMIYEPNADKRAAGTAQELLIPDKEGNTTAIRDDYVAGSSFTQLEEGKYYATQPIAKDEDGGITLQTVSAENLIVQMASAWDTASVVKTMNGQWGNTVKKPNSNDVETFGEFIDMDGYDADVNTPILLSSVAEETGNAGSSIIVELDKETPIRVRLFVWLEGQDVDCWNDIAAGTFRINLELAGETVNKGKGYEPEPVLAALKGYGTDGNSSDGWFDSTAAGITRAQITALEFTKTVPAGYTATWNAGTGTGAEAVNAYLTGTTVSIVLPDGADKTSLPENSGSIFRGMTACKYMAGMGYLDTSIVTDMNHMFSYSAKLTSLDVSGFDTSKVTSMAYMFDCCEGLTSLDVSGFDTSKVTSMQGMFEGCTKLTSLDMSGFDTSAVTDMGWMFFNDCNLTSLDVSGFDTSKVTIMYTMFRYCSKLTSLDVSGFDTSRVTSMGSMFWGCSNLISLDVSGFDTSKVTTMFNMFYGCSNLTSLDVSGFDTSAVKDMDGVFQNCTKLTSLDVSGFDTSAVTDIDWMFSGCSNLASLDVSGFDTSAVTNMDRMFCGCRNLTSLDVSGFDTSKVTDMRYMFKDCTGLTTVYAGSGFTTSNVTASAGMFTGCTALVGGNGTPYSSSKVDKTYARIDKAGEPGYFTDKNAPQPLITCTLKGYGTDGNSSDGWFDSQAAGIARSAITEIEFTDTVPTGWTKTWNAGQETGDAAINAYLTGTRVYLVIPAGADKIYLPKSCGRLFYNLKACTAINGLALTDTSNVTNMNWMFLDDEKLTTADVSGFDTSNVSDMYQMFKNCKALNVLDVSGFNTAKLTRMCGIFENCEQLTSLDVSGFDTSGVTTMEELFWGCRKLNSLDVSGFDTSRVTRMTAMFYSCSGLTSLDVTGFVTSNVTSMSMMFQGCSRLTALDLSGFDTSKVTSMSYMFDSCAGLSSLDISPLDTSHVTSMKQMFGGLKLTSLDLSSLDTSRVGDFCGMFRYSTQLTALDLSTFVTSNARDMSWMFYECGALQTLDVSGFDTSKVTDMSYMFEYCRSLSSLDLTGFNTADVTKMSHMFNSCRNLTTLDLSGFDTCKVEDFRGMFKGCSALTTIYAGSGWSLISRKVGVGAYWPTFDGCTRLVGGNGTVFSSAHNDYDYARIDKAGEPGYFTDKNASQPLGTCTLRGSDSEDWYNAAAAGIMKSNVTELIFTDTVPGDYTTTWNAGTDEGAINAYRKDKTVYVVVPEGAEKIKLPADCNYIFSYMVRLETISGLDLLDTSEVTDMSFMFASNSSMTSVDVRSFDTSNVTTMRGMFVGCRALTSLDLSGLDTSNVTSLKSLVSDCDELVTVDISSFDTADVTDMMCMFAACPKLKTIYAGSGWSTASVTDSTQMFVKCTMLTGGNGTTLSYTDKTYARIDKAGTPGYFTAK